MDSLMQNRRVGFFTAVNYFRRNRAGLLQREQMLCYIYRYICYIYIHKSIVTNIYYWPDDLYTACRTTGRAQILD